MKAVILAAGQGTRLRPLTNDKPKCLVEVAGKPLLEHQLAAMHACGLRDIHIVGGYRADQLNRPELTLHINPRFAETNMVATLFAAETIMTGESDLIIAYGDIVYESDVLRKLMACDAPVALAVDLKWQRYWAARMDDPLSDAETLKLTDRDRVIELGKKPESLDDVKGQYTGLIKIRADHVRKLSEIWHGLDPARLYDGKDRYNMFMTSFLQHLIDSGWDARAVFIENGWAEVDCVSDIAVATEFWTPHT